MTADQTKPLQDAFTTLAGLLNDKARRCSGDNHDDYIRGNALEDVARCIAELAETLGRKP